MKVIRKKFDSLAAAKAYAESVNKTLKRKAASVSEISRVDWTLKSQRPDWKTIDDLMVTWYEVCFETRSSKF